MKNESLRREWTEAAISSVRPAGPNCATLALSGKGTEASLDGKDNWKSAQILAPYGKGARLSNVSAKPYTPATQKVPLPKE